MNMIGMLYPRPLIRRLMRGGRSFEKPSLYVAAARELGEEMFFFSLADIDWRSGTARGWNGVDPVLRRRRIPDVILNRTRSVRAASRRAIARLIRMGKRVSNERNVVSKLRIHRILASDPDLAAHLPETERLTPQAVAGLFPIAGSLYLKPRNASVGNGIIRISQAEGGVIAEMNRLGRTVRRPICGMRLAGGEPSAGGAQAASAARYGVALRRASLDVGRRVASLVGSRRRRYLVQRGINLMKYRGRPVDFRVSVQKGEEGRWQCTGIVGKAGRRQAVVTNLHCGGISIKADTLFREWGWDAEKMKAEISALGLRAAQTIERKLGGVSDIGFDIALDENGHPWLIEANFRDLRITFRNAGERAVWVSTFATPVKYAAYLRRTKGADGSWKS